MDYAGLITLGETVDLSFLTESSNTPLNASAAPTFRTYGPNGLMTNGAGTSSFKNSGTITGATNASPIVITSSNHGLTTGTRVTITGVGGNTAANTTANVTVVDANSFSLDGVAGNAAYTSGGTWNVTGLYKLQVAVTSGHGYEAGNNYQVLVSGTVNSAAWAKLLSFTVV